MQVIYTDTQSYNRLFTITNTRDNVPSNAVVCAICHGQRSIRNLDDAVLGSLTNDEFMRLARMIKTAIDLEMSPRGADLPVGTELRENIWAIRATRFGQPDPLSRGLAKIHRRRMKIKSGDPLKATILLPNPARKSNKAVPDESETVLRPL